MEAKGISKLDLKRRNRKQILLALRQYGSLARVDLARQLDLTRAAVTIITNQMVTQNVLEDLNTPMPEDPAAPRRKGRKKTLIRINAGYRYLLGAMVETDVISVGLTDLTLGVIAKLSAPVTSETKTEEMIYFIVTAAGGLMKQAGLSPKQVLGMGLGIVEAHWEKLRAEQAGGRVTFPKLCYLLEMELGIPVLAGSAMMLYALAAAEYPSRQHGNQMMICAGYDYHYVVVNDDNRSEIRDLDAARINRLVVCPGGAAETGYPVGSVHAELGFGSLVRQVREAKGEMTLAEVDAAYQAGDAVIVALVEQRLQKLAAMIYNLCIASTARRVVMQNYMPGEKIRRRLQGMVETYCETPGTPELVFSDVRGDMAFLAGCALVAERLFYEQGGMLAEDRG